MQLQTYKYIGFRLTQTQPKPFNHFFITSAHGQNEIKKAYFQKPAFHGTKGNAQRFQTSCGVERGPI